MDRDLAFEMGTSNLRFGPGTTREVGMDLKDMGVKRAMVVTDPNLRDLVPVPLETAKPWPASAGGTGRRG